MTLLTARQARLAGFTLSVLCTAVLVTAALAVIWLLSLTLEHLSGVILPPVTAAILALVMKPYYTWLRRQLRANAVVASLLVMASLLIPLAIFIGFFGSVLLRELLGLLQRIPAWIDTIQASIEESWPEIATFWQENQVGQQMRTTLEKQGSALAKGAGALGVGAIQASASVFRSVAAIFSWAVFPVYFFFFNMAPAPQPKQLDEHLNFLTLRIRKNLIFLSETFISILVSFFRGQLVIALIQGALFALGFSLAGLSYGFALGLILGFLNIVPYLGNMIGLLICLPLAFFQPEGGWSTLIAVIGVIAAVQMIEGYFLTPKIMGDRTGLHPAVIIFALFFWGTLFDGVTGMILAIPLSAFLVVFWHLLRDQYLPADPPANAAADPDLDKRPAAKEESET